MSVCLLSMTSGYAGGPRLECQVTRTIYSRYLAPRALCERGFSTVWMSPRCSLQRAVLHTPNRCSCIWISRWPVLIFGASLFFAFFSP